MGMVAMLARAPLPRGFLIVLLVELGWGHLLLTFPVAQSGRTPFAVYYYYNYLFS